MKIDRRFQHVEEKEGCLDKIKFRGDMRDTSINQK